MARKYHKIVLCINDEITQYYDLVVGDYSKTDMLMYDEFGGCHLVPLNILRSLSKKVELSTVYSLYYIKEPETRLVIVDRRKRSVFDGDEQETVPYITRLTKCIDYFKDKDSTIIKFPEVYEISDRKELKSLQKEHKTVFAVDIDMMDTLNNVHFSKT